MPFAKDRRPLDYIRLSILIVQVYAVLSLVFACGIITLLFFERTVPTELLMLESAIVAALGTTLTSPYRPEHTAVTTGNDATVNVEASPQADPPNTQEEK